MRREELFLADIIEAANAIETFLQGVEKSAFLDNDLIRSAVLQKLMVIGEAASKLPREFREGYPDVPWQDIVAFRNIAVHAYFSIEWPIVWVTVTRDVPDLRRMVTGIMEEFRKHDPV